MQVAGMEDYLLFVDLLPDKKVIAGIKSFATLIAAIF